MNGKAVAVIKELDDIQRKEREARQAERAAKKAKAEAEKKARKEAKEKAKRDADNILQLEKGGLPTTDPSKGRCSQETVFYRYSDKGLQFQFGSADFASMTFRSDGTFEFKNGYKMEFSSGRQFVERSEGLFDDLKGTYDIVWGEMRQTSDGKKLRRLTKLPKVEETRPGQAIPRRPSQNGKMGSTRMMNNNRGSLRAAGSFRGIGRMGSSLLKKIGSVRFGGDKNGAAGDDANDATDAAEEVWIPTPLEIILHPSDMEARRQGEFVCACVCVCACVRVCVCVCVCVRVANLPPASCSFHVSTGIDLTQRWGCYEPQGEIEDPNSCKIMKIRRKVTPTVVGPYIFPPDPNAK